MKKTKILVVEDERVVAEDIQRSISAIGYIASGVVASGKEALEQVKKNPPDLVLMDIVLRGEMNGIETAEEIRSLYNIPVVYLTAYADDNTLNKAKVTEPFGYILKPFNDRELHSTIEMALYKHTMEKRLRESETWFSTTLKSIGEGVITTDKKGHVTFMNSVAQKLTGWSHGEAVGKQLKDVFITVRDETGKSIKSPVSRILREGNIIDLLDHPVLIARNGHRIPIDESGAPIRGDRGDIIGVVIIFKDITDRKRAEEQLQREKNFINTLMQASPAFYVAVAEDGSTLMMNEAMLKALDYKWEEVEGKDYVSTFIPEIDREKVLKINERLIGLKKNTLHESHLLTKSHRQLLVEWHGRPVLKKDGSFDFFFAMGIDVTERKKAEAALRMSEERYRGLFETMAQGVVYYDERRCIIECNPAAEEILGMKRDDMLGRHALDPYWRTIQDNGSRLPKEEHPVVISLQTGKPASNIVLGIVMPDEKKRWVLVNTTPVFVGTEKKPKSVFTTFTDITRRKEAEQALQKRNVQLNSLNVISRAVSGTLDLEVILNKALHEVIQLAEFSAGALYLFNDDTSSLELEIHKGISSRVVNLLSELHTEKSSPFRQFLLKGKTKRFAIDELLNRGRRESPSDEKGIPFMQCLVVPIKIGRRVAGSLFLFGKDKYLPAEIDDDFFTSIGGHIGMAARNARLYEETHRTLDQLRITQDKLVESEKLAGLGALASNVVHEIGNPLAAITNAIQVLQKRVHLEGRMKELMDIIGWETERLNRSVDQLREFSKPRHLKFVMGDMREVVKKAIFIMDQDFELMWGRKIVKRFPRELPLIWLDSDAMEQMMLNLIKNGLQAVHEGGVVEVSLQYRGRRPNKYVRLSVRDDGSGIQEENIQHIFEPYFSTKARGIGLGMHIVKQIVESHKGKIQVNSEEGTGTTVFVDIPVEREKDG